MDDASYDVRTEAGSSPLTRFAFVIVVMIAAVWVLRAIVGMLLWSAALLVLVAVAIGAVAVAARSRRS